MGYKVFIPTAGIGSRLENKTKNLNKSLVAIANKPVISYLMDQFDEDCEFVIALGYKGNLVKEYLELIYPNKKFTFVEIDLFKGPGSGLGYTMLQSRKFLQEPFIFCSCDTIISNKIAPPLDNWVGYSLQKSNPHYRGVLIHKENISKFVDKNQLLNENVYPYIGLSSINDYDYFWEIMINGGNEAIEEGEVYALKNMLQKKYIKAKDFQWRDMGNLISFKEAEDFFKRNDSPVILEKEDEHIWFIENKVVKYSSDKNFIKNRIKRAEVIKNFIPKINGFSTHMYSYEKAKGEVLAKSINLKVMDEFLNYSKKFWNDNLLVKPPNIELFKKDCKKFYKDKTTKRVDMFFRKFDKKDSETIINGVKITSIQNLFNALDWENISNGIPTNFHGDFHFENIIFDKGKDSFVFIDWRQDFAGDINFGDIYYDLAKIMHGIIVSHDLINQNHFSVSWLNNNINFQLHRTQNLVDCEKFFVNWLAENEYSVDKVYKITALIYLNIAALHHNPYSLMLYSLGKFMLNQYKD